MSSASARDWRTCRVCGGAVPGDQRICPTCGQTTSVATDQIAKLPTGARRRVRAVQVARSLIVIGVAVGLAYALISAVWSGPPTFADPLTTRGTYTIAPGNFTYLSNYTSCVYTHCGSKVTGKATGSLHTGSAFWAFYWNSTSVNAT
ncbi:MAG: hypothetical protein L3J73_00165, partial [Thermoplasmata archaeon]|nr:hypothetical protein [Thermoplasmata archaeon]